MPGRMVFFTVPDGSTTLTERARINNAGYFLINTTAPDAGGDAGFGRLAVRDNDDNTATVKAMASNASYAGRVFQAQATRAANTAYSFFLAQSDVNGTPDIEFNLRGDGSGFCDGAWTGGGADYAEYFEWADGNPDNEDRRGISVTLDGDKITPAKSGDIVIGVISSNPSVVGDAAYLRWTGKYLTDDYGSPIVENYEVYEWVETVMIDDEPHIVQHSYAFDQIPEGIKPPKDAKKTTQTRRTVNPQYDPNIVYVPREDRPEWATVGLMGKLRVRKGQQVAPHWVKMRDISDTVEEWLVK
jgi:hypothetical protein